MGGPLTEQQVRSIAAIVAVFETGRVPGPAAYSTATILEDGAGISYGVHQATDKSGSLDAVVLRYLDLGGSLARRLLPYLDELAANETALADPRSPPAWVMTLLDLLREAGRDPAMIRAQEEVFAERYWLPAQAIGRHAGCKLALTYAVLYDTAIQSGPDGIWRIRRRFKQDPPSSGADERAWARAYLQARKAWLAAHPNPLVQRTTYRVEALEALAADGNWELRTPFTVRGQTWRG